MARRRRDRGLECEERFFVVMGTLALSGVLFLLFTLIKNVTGDDYLYSVMEDHGPVQEYIAPSTETKGSKTYDEKEKAKKKEVVLPSFLTDPEAPNRVVEYYAVSCTVGVRESCAAAEQIHRFSH